MNNVSRSTAITTFALQFHSMVCRINKYEDILRQRGGDNLSIAMTGDDGNHKYDVTANLVNGLKFAALERCGVLISLGAKDVVRGILAYYE